MTRLHPGDPAPDLTLVNAEGRTVTLSELRGRPAVVYFFPKAFTPGCTAEVCDFRDHRADFTAAGATVLGVSADPPRRLAEFRDQYGVEHDLLSDPGAEAAQRWGAYGPKTVSGQPTEGPLRSTFVLDAEGVVTSAEYELDPDGHVATLLTRLS